MSLRPPPGPDLPGPGQESVWDYPRPPAVDASGEHVEIWLDDEPIAATDAPLRVLETSHPPTYYLPRSAFRPDVLRPTAGSSFCEFKGSAAYVDLVGPRTVAAQAGWHYPDPTAPYARLRDHVAVYPGRTGWCTVNGERVRAQAGDFYGGWITDRVVGPFKGGAGSRFW